MLSLDFLRSAYDHALGRPKTAFPTRYHYIEILRDELAKRSIGISRLGQHCLVLENRDTGRGLIVVVRYTNDKDLRLLEQAASRPGTRIAYLLDDDLWAMLEDPKLREDYRARLQHFILGYFSRLRPLLDLAIAPSRQILGRLPDLPGIHMQPAHLSPTGDLSHFDTRELVRVVFLGTSTHGADFKKVAPGIAGALADHPRLYLTTLLGKRGGVYLPEGPQVSHLKDMFFAPFQSWLARQRFHIALTPYEPNPVNDGRSNLKFHQHAFVGAAGLYTETAPFVDCVVSGVNGLVLAHEPEAWREAISGLTLDLEQAKTMSSNAIEASRIHGEHQKLADLWMSLIGE